MRRENRITHLGVNGEFTFDQMKMSRFSLLCIIILPFLAKAQFNDCIDSNRINPYYQCNDPSFDPVCGCNNVTYRNGCEMTNVGGVNYSSPDQNGVCRSDFFFFYYYPNPVFDRINLSMQFASQEISPATMLIYDVYGNVVYSMLLNNIQDFPTFPQTIYLNNLESGVYIMGIQSRDVSKMSKFIKHTY